MREDFLIRREVDEHRQRILRDGSVVADEKLQIPHGKELVTLEQIRLERREADQIFACCAKERKKKVSYRAGVSPTGQKKKKGWAYNDRTNLANLGISVVEEFNELSHRICQFFFKTREGKKNGIYLFQLG